MKKESIQPIVLTNRDQAKDTLVYSLYFITVVIVLLISYVIFDYDNKFIVSAGLFFACAMWAIIKSVKMRMSMPDVIEFIRIDENGIRIRDEKEWFIPWQKVRSITFYNKYPQYAKLHMGLDYERNGDVASLRINLQPYSEILVFRKGFRKWKKAIDYYSGRDDIVTNKHLNITRLEADNYNPFSPNNIGKK